MVREGEGRCVLAQAVFQLALLTDGAHSSKGHAFCVRAQKIAGWPTGGCTGGAYSEGSAGQLGVISVTGVNERHKGAYRDSRVRTCIARRNAGFAE